MVESATRSLQLGLSLRHVTCYCAKLGLDMVTYCATTAAQCPVFGQIFNMDGAVCWLLCGLC